MKDKREMKAVKTLLSEQVNADLKNQNANINESMERFDKKAVI